MTEHREGYSAVPTDADLADREGILSGLQGNCFSGDVIL